MTPTTPTQDDLQKARELFEKIDRPEKGVIEELAQLICAARERDELKRSCDTHLFNIEKIAAERDSYREKAKALDWLEQHCKQLEPPIKFIHQPDWFGWVIMGSGDATAYPTLLAAIQKSIKQ